MINILQFFKPKPKPEPKPFPPAPLTLYYGYWNDSERARDCGAQEQWSRLSVHAKMMDDARANAVSWLWEMQDELFGSSIVSVPKLKEICRKALRECDKNGYQEFLEGE